MAVLVAAGLTPIVLTQVPSLGGAGSHAPSSNGGLLSQARKTGGTPSVTTLGNQERQDITAANQWAEGNLDYWLESHLYDTEVRFDAGNSNVTVPSLIDFAMSFYFSNKNAITIDWSQDWHVTLNQSSMYWTKTSAPAGAPYACPTPPGIVPIGLHGKTIDEPLNGSVCIQGVQANTTGNVNTGWLDVGGLPLAQLNQVLPKRNEPCTSVSSVTGLCVSGAETEATPAAQHYFEVNFSALFGPGGVSPQSWWPNLPAGMSLALYFRNHLALTPVWETSVGGAGGGSQPQFCINTTIGARLNTHYDRCGWTNISRLGAGAAAGSSNHGNVIAPGIGSKTIPLPNVISPSGFITVCKVVTTYANDTTGALGNLTDNWTMHVQGPFETNETHPTGFTSPGCARFGPLFPTNYTVSETMRSGYVGLGTVVTPSGDRLTGTNPNLSNPVNVSISITEANAGSGPNVTFVNLIPNPKLIENCTVTVRNGSGQVVNRTYAIVGDTVTHNYTVTNDGNVPLNITQNHTNTAVFGPNPLFTGVLYPGQSHSTFRSVIVNSTNLMDLSDSCSSVGFATVGGGNVSANSSSICHVGFAAPNISFVKHPVAADNVTVLSGGCVEINITVTNSGNASAWVNVSDALAAGQTLLDGGPLTSQCGSPSSTPSLPLSSGDYPAPVTIAWNNVSVDANSSVTFSFWVIVTATADGAQVTGNMTLTARNANGANYTPAVHTAEDVITVLAPNVSFIKHPVAADNVSVVPGGCLEITISVSNTGSAAAWVNVSDALDAGQTLLDGGAQTDQCGAPSPAPSLPLAPGDYAAPVTIAWDNVSVGVNETVNLTFWVIVTKTTDGAQVTGNMTLTAVNANGIDYTPATNTARDVATVVRPILKLTEFGYTNAPNGTPTSGVVNGTTVYTVTFTNFGDNASLLSGYLNVSVSSGAGGSLTCWASSGPAALSGCSLHWTNVSLAPFGQAGDSVTFTLTISYANMPSGAAISAALTASYISSVGGTTYVPSGVPATIEFTIEGV